jgi:[DsrC]-trisulfide reductase subunit M
MMILAPLIAVLAFVIVAWVGASIGLDLLFGVVIPYAAITAFLAGAIWRVLSWAKTPVPFNITTTCGQQVSLPWIKNDPIENPHTKTGVVIRMLLEVFCFRSLFRNVRTEIIASEKGQPRVAYKTTLWLWLAGLAFHYAFLVVIIRHFRFFLDPFPACLRLLEALDGFFQAGSPTIFISGFVLAGAVGYLALRRFLLPQMRTISLTTDYFPLFLILGIAVTGGLMRYTPLRVDITEVKNLCMGLMRFNPQVASGAIDPIFYIHLILVCVLFAYLPFSKLSHMFGVFLSPTRNLVAASRMHRHVNPWDYPVKVHSYEEYEDDFRDKMKSVGIPVDKE